MLDPRRLLGVDQEARLQVLDGPCAHIDVFVSADHVEDKAFAQSGITGLHCLDVECFHQPVEHSQATRNNALTVLTDALELQCFCATGFCNFKDQFVERFSLDYAVSEAKFCQHPRRGLDRARATHGLLPPEIKIGFGYRLQL